MRKWIWRFKAYPSNRNITQRFIARSLEPMPWLIALSIVVVIVVSCRLHIADKQQEEPQSAAAPEPQPESKLKIGLTAIFGPREPSYLPLYTESSGTEKTLVAELDDEGCKDDTKVIKFRTYISTVFGEPNAQIISFDRTAPILANLNWLKSVCSDDTTVRVAPEFVATIRQALLAKAPDCRFTASPPWQCRLPEVTPNEAQADLAKLKETMIRRWSRQPYVLARRTAVSIQLAKAAMQQERIQISNDKSSPLQRFCAVLQHSQAAELPLVMRAKPWREALCQSKENQAQVARIGLAKALTELDLLKSLFEASSKLGVLTVRIPHKDIPDFAGGKAPRLTVSLTPEADVADNLVSQVDHPAPPCWHPLFADSELWLASYLNLTQDRLPTKGKTTGLATAIGECDIKPQGDIVKNYLADSMTCDTEFGLINGQAKMLRLPVGTYSYKVFLSDQAEHPTIDVAFEAEDEAAPPVDELMNKPEDLGVFTSGNITWEAKRPRPLISTWNKATGQH